ncbi:unnamed protein product [Vicia faba]|uniref:Uncharacterized protein n=1 Tax=Vicia faba TaxID=3906 RepID=A0AAV0YR16_VICFA|nr:unnamed protein product [Vicia faba]
MPATTNHQRSSFNPIESRTQTDRSTPVLTLVQQLQWLFAYSQTHVEKERKRAQDDDIAATSYVKGQYSIPNCIDVLIIVNQKKQGRGDWSDDIFSYALELIKDSKNRVIVIYLKNRLNDLANWINHKYDSRNR